MQFWTITIGNVVEIAAIAGGGAVFLIQTGVKLGSILSTLKGLAANMMLLEKRITELERQNTLPIPQRRAPRLHE